MPYQTYTLSNGLRIIHRPTSSAVSYCGFTVNAGTRDESAGKFGLAHFVEHMIFKGTTHRRSWHILNRMETVGGELNAYTTKEETVIYSVFLEEHLSRAMDLLADLVINSQFPAHELEKEREVILDEINSYRDTPSELIYDEFENRLFSGHALGHNILGSQKDLESLCSEDGHIFLTQQYHPGNMIFFSMGKTEFKKIIRLAEHFFSAVPLSSHKNNRIPPGHNPPFHIQEKMETFQAHTILGTRAYHMFDPKRHSLYLLNNILGGPGMNSLLNVSLREKTGYVYNVESSVTSYTDTGIFSIYFGSDPKNTEKCLQLIHKELNRLRTTALTQNQLNAAKKQLLGQLGVATENKENTALNMGKNFLHYGSCSTTEEVARRIESITSKEILETANELFSEEKLSTLIFH